MIRFLTQYGYSGVCRVIFINCEGHCDPSQCCNIPFKTKTRGGLTIPASGVTEETVILSTSQYNIPWANQTLVWTDFGQGWLLRSEFLRSMKHAGPGIKGLALILGSSTNRGPWASHVASLGLRVLIPQNKGVRWNHTQYFLILKISDYVHCRSLCYMTSPLCCKVFYLLMIEGQTWSCIQLKLK